MLQNAYLLAKIGADTAENERNFAENLPTTLRVVGKHCDPGGIERELRHEVVVHAVDLQAPGWGRNHRR